jgi:plasmid stabilization system protein ParE
MTEFIFMLTKDDETVADALAVYDEVRGAQLRFVGFKDIGQPASVLRDLARRIQADGRTAVLEVVSIDRDSEIGSVEAGLEMGVDMLMGGTHPDDVLPLLRGSVVRYFPFPGRVLGHPSVLSGSIEEIAEGGRALTSRPGVAGLDLLAFRHRGDVPDLIATVVAASSGPVVVAGSVDSVERIHTIARTGAWGFTVGGAVFDRAFVRDGSLRFQIDEVLRQAQDT